jgi:hypothetical protein
MTTDDFMPETEEVKETEVKGNKKYQPYDIGKRGAIFKEEWGKRRRRGIDLGLSDMALPPITRKTVATYRVIQREIINPATKEPAEIQPLYLPGSYIFYDKFEPDLSKRNKEVRNFTGRKELVRQQNGEQRMEDIIEMVIFHNGVIKVDIESQYPLYVFIELHPCNRSNRLRPNIQAEFERIDLSASKSIAFKSAEEELGDEAIIVIRKLDNKDLIIGYAASAGLQTMENGKQRDLALIKSDLRSYALKDPRGFFSLSKNTKYAVKMTVLEADSIGIIEFDSDKRKWITPLTDEPLFTALVSDDPVESFAKFLNDPKNVEMYDAIRNSLDYWQH